MKKLLTIKTISYVICLTFITGCTSLPFAERQANATTEVSEKWSRDQTERITATIGALSKTENGGTFDWSVDSSEQGNGDQSLLGGIEKNIPGGIKLILTGLGILVLLFAVKRVIQSSTALKALAKASDEALAKPIRSIQGYYEASTDEKSRSMLMKIIKDIEVERGKLKT